MNFKIAARTVLELGAELISSDAIAIYELVKNAFDAGSPSVSVEVNVFLRRSTYEKLLDALEAEQFETLEDALEELTHRLLEDGGEAEWSDFLEEAAESRDATELATKLREAYRRHNTIRIRDTGSGMSLDKLKTAFLTIGTPDRLSDRARADGRSILGEKGVGRLSAMRLGSKLRLRTTGAEDENWNILEIDWDDFRDPALMLEDVEVTPRIGRAKRDLSAQGTVLTIRDLSSDWTLKGARSMASAQFSRLVDPFLPASQTFPINLSFNGKEIEIRGVSSILFRHAHGVCDGNFRIEKRKVRGRILRAPRLTASFEYKLYNEKQDFDLGASELRDAIGDDIPEGALVDLGPFNFKFYWYNRRLLGALDGIGERVDVRNLVNAWSGGLMVFRDGFRVNPYGGPGDDWLDLNTQAFRSSGYLLNTDQIIGRVSISAAGNPGLVDQTNREGLRENFEETALERVLHQFLTVHLKKWMDDVNEAYQGLKQVDLREIEENVRRYERRVNMNLKELRERFPGEAQLVEQLVAAFSDMRLAFDRAKGAADKAEKDRQRLVELAGVGLMVEVVAHELARATKHTLDILRGSARRDAPESFQPVLDTLGAQLTTIERRLRVLDPLSVSGRQRRTEFDLVDAVRGSFVSRSDDLAATGIEWSCQRADGKHGAIWVKAVRGMVIQVVENLLANSIHWLGRESAANRRFKPQIHVEVSADLGGSFTFTDNGPGIAPQAAGRIFDAFYTTRHGEGRGLGLYIAGENARAMGGDLVLLPDRPVHEDRLNSFRFSLVQPN